MLFTMASSSRKLIELFYDVSSPYSWLAFEGLCRYKSHWNMELALRPMYLGGLITAISDGKPFFENLSPQKLSYSAMDCPRVAKYFGVNFKSPENVFEVIVTKGTLKPLRFLTAVSMEYPEHTEELSRQLWQRIYSQDLDVTEAASLREAAMKAGMNEKVIEDALSRISDPKVKDKLKAVTQEAVDLGAFGAPFIVAQVNGKKEIFFGSDRLPILAMVIGEAWKGPHPDKL